MITLKNVVLRRGSKVILDSASVSLNPGEKIGLVGRNGAGKSSLFAMLNGTLHEDGGEYYIPAQWKMAQVAQDMPETEQSATSYVIEGDVVLLAAQAEVDASEISGDPECRAHLESQQRDAQSLTDHAGHQAAHIAFLLDAALGLINIEQNGIIKFFSVVAVVFMPPTLIASIYGMNFDILPELHWRAGYPMALLAMLIAAILPVLWFKRRGWL